MKISQKRVAALALSILGAAIAFCSPVIVFPGLERLLGIETIVGSRNVVYNADGSYAFTGPGAMLLWIAGVAAVGVVLCVTGIRMLLTTRKSSR